MGIKKICLCGQEFDTTPYKIKTGRGKYCSRACFYEYGNKGAFKLGHDSWSGKKHSEETKKKIGESNKGKIKGRFVGDKNPNWKGGVSSKSKIIRESSKHKDWRKAVFERDNYTCLWCKKRGGKLNADHIRPFAKFPKLRFDVNNGRTLCVDCHRKTPTYGAGSSNLLKICVTGCAGYLGDNVVEQLLNSTNYVFGVDNLTYSSKYMRFHELFDFNRLDITDEKFLSRLEEINPDVVVHLAGIVGDGACASNPEKTVDVNQSATLKIAQYCRENSKHLVFASTCSVFGANDNLVDELGVTNPLSLYAGTKLKAEDYVRMVPKHTIFRFGTLFGMSSEHARIRCDLVANILSFKGIQGDTLIVFGGEQYRPLLHVSDAANAIKFIIEKQKYGTYVIAEDNYTIDYLAKKVSNVIKDITNEEVIPEISQTDMPFEDLRNYKVDTSKIRGVGWTPKVSLEWGLKDMIGLALEGRIADYWNLRYHNAHWMTRKDG